MLESWLLPPNLHALGITAAECEYHQIGKNINIYHAKILLTEGGEVLSPHDIALIGINALEADRVRKYLYTMTNTWDSCKIWDLGNLIKNTPTQLTQLVRELLQLKVCPILIGISPSFCIAQMQSYQNIKTHFSLALIEASIPYAPQQTLIDHYYLNAIFQLKKPHLHQLSIIGFQSHLTPNKVIELCEEKNVQLFRLGKARQQLDELEPTLREIDMLSINLSALKYAEAPSQLTPSVTGFWVEELCQLMRFAGASDRLSSLGLYGFEQKSELLTAQTTATLIWYFLDGFFYRKNDLPIQDFFTKNQLDNQTHLATYSVTINDLNIDLLFYKSYRSGRWWVQIPFQQAKKEKNKIKLVAISYSDYLKACQGELSDRLFDALK